MSAWTDLIAADSAAAWYRADEGSGTTLADSSGHTRNGTIAASGVTYNVTSLVSGDADKALTLDGTAGELQSSSDASLGFSGTDFTIMAIYKQSAGNLVVGRDNTSANGFVLPFSNVGIVTGRIAGTNLTSPMVVPTLQDGRPHLMALRRSGTVGSLWIDGIKIAEATVPTTGATLPWHLGRNGSNTGSPNFAAATVDEWLFFGAALSDARMRLYAKTALAIADPPSSAYPTAVLALANLLGYWPLNEPGGPYGRDIAGGVGPAYAVGGISYAQASLLPGDPGNGSMLLGSSGRLAAAEVSALDVTDTFTLMAWIQPADVSSDLSVIYKSPFCYGMFLRGSTVGLGVLRGEGAVNVASPAYQLVAGSPYFCVLTYDKNAAAPQANLYINGVLMASGTSTSSLSTSGNVLEFGSYGGGALMKGSMQHAALVGRALTATEIRNLYILGAANQAEQDGLSAQVYSFVRLVLAADGSRKRASFSNDSNRPIYLLLADPGTTPATGAGRRLNANGDGWDTEWQGEVWAYHKGILGAKTLGITKE